MIVEQFNRMAERRSAATSSRSRASLAKGRFVLRTESPQGLIMYGLSREVLEGQVLEPDELLAKIDAVTAEDVQRVART